MEARQARKDDARRIRKCVAIVVCLRRLSGFAMAVLAVIKQMKGRNVQFVGDSGGNSPRMLPFQELQI